MPDTDAVIDIFKENDVYPLIERTLVEKKYLEHKLTEYREAMDSIKLTAATKAQYNFYSKLYLDTLAKHNTVVATLLRIVGKEEAEADSPLRAFLNGLEIR